jgi:response regulator of citrate/malate metabolism
MFGPLSLTSLAATDVTGGEHVFRRRPLARAAMVGGAAYYAGKRHEQNVQEDEYTQARLDQLEAQQAMQAQAQAQAAPPPAAAGISDDTIQQLQKLGELKAAGVLTEEEFNQQKQRLLQGT